MKTESIEKGPVDALRTGARPHRPEDEGLRPRLRSFLQGHDLFISYSHWDGFWYAHNLANRLADLGFACYLDQLETVPDVNVPEKVLAELRRSTRMLIVGSPCATQSKAIKEEIKTFLGTERHIILIDFERAVDSAVWAGLVPGLAPLSEKLSALERSEGRPADDVIDSISAAGEYTRRNRRVRNTFLFMLAGIILAVGLGVTSVAWARAETAEANEKTGRALADQAAAEVAAHEARLREARARERERLAGVRLAAADVLRFGAEWLQGVAEGRAEEADAKALSAEAREAAALEKEKAANERAEVARRLSLARQLAAQSEAAREEKTGQLELSALLAIESVNQSPTLDGALALRRALSLYREPVGELEYASGELKFRPGDKTTLAAGGASRVDLWRGLGRSAAPSLSRLEHPDDVADFEFVGPQLLLLATACKDGVRIFDVSDGALKFGPLRHGGPVNAIVFGTVGQRLLMVTAGDDGTIRFWDTATGKEDEAQRITVPGEAGTPAKVTEIALGSGYTGETLAAAVDGKNVRLWSLPRGRELLRQQIPYDGSRRSKVSLKLSHEGRHLFIGITTEAGRVAGSLWEVMRERGPQQTAGETEPEDSYRLRLVDPRLNAAAFSHYGTFFATAFGNAALVYSNDVYPVVIARLAHDGEVINVAFSEDNAFVATTGSDLTTRVWRIVGGDRYKSQSVREATRIEQSFPHPHFALSSDGGLLVMTPDKDRLAVYPVHGEALAQTGEVADGGPVPHLEPSRAYLDVFYSADGRHMVAVESEQYSVKEVEGGRVVMTGRRSKADGNFRPAAVSPGGALLAGWAGDELRLRETAAHDEGYAHRVKVAGAAAGRGRGQIVFSPDGKRLAVEAGGNLIVWKVEGSRLANEWLELSLGAEVGHLAFNPVDSRCLATSKAGLLRLWNVERGAEFESARRGYSSFPDESSINGLAFSPDGSRLVALTRGSETTPEPPANAAGVRYREDGGERIRVWKFTGGVLSQEQSVLLTYPAVGLAFGQAAGRDGGRVYLAVATLDSGVEVRTWPDLTQVAGISPEGRLGLVSFGPGARQLFTLPWVNPLASVRPSPQAWLLLPAELVDDARRRVPKRLTEEQARSFRLAGDRLCSVCPAPGGRR